MDGFSVSPAELRQVASSLSQLCGGLDEHVVMRYSMEPQAVHHEGLRQEIETFQDRLAAAVGQLHDDTRETGHRLEQTADVYERIDGEGAERVKLTGN